MIHMTELSVDVCVCVNDSHDRIVSGCVCV